MAVPVTCDRCSKAEAEDKAFFSKEYDNNLVIWCVECAESYLAALWEWDQERNDYYMTEILHK